MFNFFSKSKQRLKLPVVTDIHCHILPGIDDGSPDAATSVRLVERMQSWGIERIYASPHVTKERFENTPDTIAASYRELRSALDQSGNGITVGHHAEYRLDDFSLGFFDLGEIMSLGDRYVMFENPFVSEAWFIDNVIFDLQVKGFTPILAHPERYSYYISNRERYRRLHDAGAKFQINVLSLAGAYGKEQRHTAEYLIGQQMVDFIGTDLHNEIHADIIDDYLSSRHAQSHFASVADRLLNDTI